MLESILKSEYVKNLKREDLQILEYKYLSIQQEFITEKLQYLN